MNIKVSNNRFRYLLPWIVCAFGAIFYGYQYFLRIMPSVMNLELRHYFLDINDDTFGLLSAVYYYSYVPMQLPVGILMDHYGMKRLLSFACLLCVIGVYLFVAQQSMVLAVIGRFIVGFGSAFAFIGVLKLATVWLPEEHFALFAGLAAALGAIGAVLGNVLLQKMLIYMSWHHAIYYSALTGLVLTALLLWIIQDKNPTKIQSDENKYDDLCPFKQNMENFYHIIRDRQVWLVGLIGCLIYLPTTVFAEMWGIPYLEHARGYSPSEAGLAISALFVGFAIGAPSMGWLSEMIKTRRLLLIDAFSATILMAVIIYYPITNHALLYLLLLLLGMFHGGQALVFEISRKLSPKKAKGTTLAVTNMIVMLGGISLQPIVGIILEQSWSGQIISNLHVYDVWNYKIAFIALPVGIFVSGVLAWFLKD